MSGIHWLATRCCNDHEKEQPAARGRTLTLSDYPLLYPKALAKRINRDGPASNTAVRAIAAALASVFVPP